jgi:murein L,D-transpeptidase YcbB/YkuD
MDNSMHVAGIHKAMDGRPAWVDDGALGKKLWTIERTFYESRNYVPAWVNGSRTTPQMNDLLQQLRYSAAHGLDPSAFGIAEFDRQLAASKTRIHGTQFDVREVPQLDARLTYAYLRYAADLLGWGMNPRDIDRDWLTSPRKEDLAARLSIAVSDGRVRETLEELAPAHPQYKGLQAALARERENPTGKGELLRMNLERWRWVPRNLGQRYILINVPAYQLQVVEGEKPVLAMRVIVGKPDTPTPLFSDEMTYVVFSPYWNIPENILREETLPRAVSDPAYLARNNIEVVSGGEVIDPASIDWADASATTGLRFRQEPGDKNALGLVKFIFPNHFNVYLHDTPSDRLFNRATRALSHGCIRVEQPLALAEYVLRDHPQWTSDRMVKAMNSHSEQAVTLKTKLPVHIGYWTAWVEGDGSVTFLGDPYGIDQAQARMRGATRSALAMNLSNRGN